MKKIILYVVIIIIIMQSCLLVSCDMQESSFTEKNFTEKQSSVTTNQTRSNTSADSSVSTTRRASSSSSSSSTPATVDVTKIRLNSTNLSLLTGQSKEIKATISPSNATNKSIKWESTNESVAKVQNGTVIAVGEGNATIIATASNGISAFCSVTVGVNVTKIYFANQKVEIIVGQTGKVTCYYQPDNAAISLVSYKWSTADPNIATVDQSGNVTAVARGTTQLLFQTDTGLSASCQIVCLAYKVQKPSIPLTLSFFHKTVYVGSGSSPAEGTFTPVTPHTQIKISSFEITGGIGTDTSGRSYFLMKWIIRGVREKTSTDEDYIPGNQGIRIYYKILDSSNAIIDSNYIQTPILRLEEGFVVERDFTFSVEKFPEGDYRIELYKIEVMN